MVQWVEIRHDQHQVAGFLHRQKSGPDEGGDSDDSDNADGESDDGDGGENAECDGDGCDGDDDLGTLSPMALSKHFMAAPMAVTSWYALVFSVDRVTWDGKTWD